MNVIRLAKDTVYFIWNVITFGKGVTRTIDDFVIRFPPKWSRYFEAEYEKENVAFMKAYCKNGMTVLDVGAHLGLLSVIGGKLVAPGGKVFSFEPTPSTFSVLNTIIGINSLSGIVTPIHSAVSEENTEADFMLDAHPGSNANSLVKRADKERNVVRVKVVTLDSIVKKHQIARVHFIKIDAEGTELSVLRGAASLIDRDRPIIILAIHPFLIRANNQKLEDIYSLLQGWRYSILHYGILMEQQAFCTYPDFFDVHLLPSSA